MIRKKQKDTGPGRPEADGEVEFAVSFSLCGSENH